MSLIFEFVPMQAAPSIAERKELIWKTANELRYNRQFLTELVLASERNAKLLPPGKASADALVELMQEHYEVVTEESYGEEKHLYQLSLQLKHLAERISVLETAGRLSEFQRHSHWSVEDTLFLNDFFNWYLRHLIVKELNNHQLHSLGTHGFPSEEFRIQGIDTPALRYFFQDGQLMVSFLDFLGAID